MEKQPIETEEQSFNEICDGHILGIELTQEDQDQLLKLCTDFRDRRQKIEAQQVAGMSFRECVNAIHKGQQYLEISEVFSKAAEMYASACVAEKERQLQTEIRINQQLKDDCISSQHRIQELESRQPVTDEEIEDRCASVCTHAKSYSITIREPNGCALSYPAT